MKNSVGFDEDCYPRFLKEIPDYPNKIFGLGNIELLKSEKLIAVVGSRNMSDYGKKVINSIVPELVKNEWVIVSGMAFGVDAEVQKVCVESGGKTIAILASGADMPSPRSNRWLYEMILKKEGLIISEHEWGSQPRREYFLARNRIMAGMCRATILIEGGKRSGTIATARLAVNYGREVYCIPGRINEENSYAPNYMIKNGANILTEYEDIFETLA